jgi:putative N6-adenine-specific DNA methylase
VARELTDLGEQPRIDDGGVSWTGDARSVMRANLWLRTASRVLVRIATFDATKFHELERLAKKIEWGRFLTQGTAPEFRVTARKSKLYHSDAIAERLSVAATAGTRKAGGRQTAGVSQLFVVRVVRDHFEISADTSGELLHMRGYRQAVGKAPLRETLAAALLLGAGWKHDTPFIDPFCGSGTLPIEAAMMARRIAPGLHRDFAFQHWPGFDAAAWSRERAEAQACRLASAPLAIAGSDRDAGAITSARANAERAGVTGDIGFETKAVSAIEPPGTPGLLASNPPYGKRIGRSGDPRNLYAQLGKVLRTRCRGWQFALYAPEERLLAQLDQPYSELFRTSNGGIRVSAIAGIVAQTM